MSAAMHALLSVAEMGEADRMTIAAGTPGIDLMEHAGRAIFEAARDLVPPGRAVLVICGAGNNGGDGFIAARLLREDGCKVSVVLAGDAARLKGDAQIAHERWAAASGDKLLTPGEAAPARHGLVIDALFGAGLDRPITGELADLVSSVNAADVPVVAADLPSGIHGDTGAIMGVAIRATRSVTFFRKKPGHLLMPGRAHCGEVRVAEIGIDPDVLSTIGPVCFENGPDLWRAKWPAPAADGHKYDRGHALVVSGPATRTGAARLSARAALRIGAGLVTVASPAGALAENAAQLTAIMLREAEGASGLTVLLEDRRFNALVLGPGLGTGPATREIVLAALAAGRTTVLDADALTSFAEHPQLLFDAIAGSGAPVVLTPHGGEFGRLFANEDGDKRAAAREAARKSGAVVVFKGADTVIAAPSSTGEEGRAAINANAPAFLATAGAGDVLAGMIAGLLAQGMPGFEAACAAVWLHGAAAARFGPGLIAEDLEKTLPQVLAAL